MNTMPCKLTCTWVPGTLDRIRVNTPEGQHEIGLSQVRTVLGKEAVQDLYLRGRYTLLLTEAALGDHLLRLGCAVPPVHPLDTEAAVAPSYVKAPLGRPALGLPRAHAGRGSTF